jgi:hypothetical protein
MHLFAKSNLHGIRSLEGGAVGFERSVRPVPLVLGFKYVSFESNFSRNPI